MRQGDDGGQHDFAIGIDVGAAMAGQEAAVDLDRIDKAGCAAGSGSMSRCRKSSIESPAPAARKRSSIGTRRGSAATVLSVISRCSVPAAMAVLARMDFSKPSKLASRTWRREKIDADEQRRFEREVALPVRKIGRSPFQGEASQRDDQAGFLGMGNEIDGEIRPRPGWRQRSSASKPATQPSASRMIGW